MTYKFSCNKKSYPANIKSGLWHEQGHLCNYVPTSCISLPVVSHTSHDFPMSRISRHRTPYFTSLSPLSRAPESQVPVHASQRPRPHVSLPVPFKGTDKFLSGKAWLRRCVVTFRLQRHCPWSDVKPLTKVLVLEWKGELAPGNWCRKLHSLVPRRSLLSHRPREVWERAGESLSMTSQFTIGSRFDRAENA